MKSSRVFSYSSSFTTARSQNSFQQQTTVISVDSTILKSPHVWKIETTGNTELSGQLSVNGQAIAKLQGSQVSVNLSPHLAKGINQVDISGNYKPETSLVSIGFSGLNTKVTQQVGGSGRLRQTLIINLH